MAGLREKQKEERQRRILESARRQFKDANYRDVTIEAIADDAGLSAMTVFNYYGSKGGLLLSLVAESDRHLIEKIDDVLATEFDDAISAVKAFSLTVINHAFSYLDRKTWGYVLSTAILEGDSTFGRGYAELERQLRNLLADLLEKLKNSGLIAKDCDCGTAATVIYNAHNARFIEYAADPHISRGQIDERITRDLGFIVDRLT